MKRFLSVLFCIILLTGCGTYKKEDDFSFDKPFKAEILLNWKDKSYQGELVRENSNSLTLSVWGGELLQPVCYKIADGGYRITQGDLELSIPLEAAPKDSAAVMINEAFLMFSTARREKRNNTIAYTLPTAEFVFDQKEEKPLSLSVKSGDITFNEFTFVNVE